MSRMTSTNDKNIDCVSYDCCLFDLRACAPEVLVCHVKTWSQAANRQRVGFFSPINKKPDGCLLVLLLQNRCGEAQRIGEGGASRVHDGRCEGRARARGSYRISASGASRRGWARVRNIIPYPGNGIGVCCNGLMLYKYIISYLWYCNKEL